MYLSVGVAILLIDVARDWCDLDYGRTDIVEYAIFWPLRLLLGDYACGGE